MYGASVIIFEGIMSFADKELLKVNKSVFHNVDISLLLNELIWCTICLFLSCWTWRSLWTPILTSGWYGGSGGTSQSEAGTLTEWSNNITSLWSQLLNNTSSPRWDWQISWCHVVSEAFRRGCCSTVYTILDCFNVLLIIKYLFSCKLNSVFQMLSKLHYGMPCALWSPSLQLFFYNLGGLPWSSFVSNVRFDFCAYFL